MSNVSDTIRAQSQIIDAANILVAQAARINALFAAGGNIGVSNPANPQQASQVALTPADVLAAFPDATLKTALAAFIAAITAPAPAAS